MKGEVVGRMGTLWLVAGCSFFVSAVVGAGSIRRVCVRSSVRGIDQAAAEPRREWCRQRVHRAVIEAHADSGGVPVDRHIRNFHFVIHRLVLP